MDRAIKHDLPKLHEIRSIDELKKVFVYLCYNSSSVINVEAMCKEFEGVSKPTIEKYIQYAGQPIQYIEAKMRYNSTVKDDNGIVIYGMKDIPGYVISKNATDYALTKRKETQLYRIPAFAFLYLIGKNQKDNAVKV